MNTQNTTQNQQTGTEPRQGRSLPRTVRRALAALVLSLGLVSGLAATAAPAQAASAVSFCFNFANPPAHSAYANRPVYLYYKAPHGWEYLGTRGYTNANGCGTFYNTPTDARLAVRAYINTRYQTWDGWSRYSSNTGWGRAHLGNAMVYRTR